MKKVKIVEVGLRDGLQNEKNSISIENKIKLAQALASAGSENMELGAFVSPKWIPQMAGSKEIVESILNLQKQNKLSKKIQFSTLVPNEKGMQEALQSGIKEVALFTACTDGFTQKNINCTIEESFERFKPVMTLAQKNKIKVRGYLSTCFGCPFDGAVPEKKVLELTEKLFDLGVYEVSISDTIGIAHTAQVEKLFKKLIKKFPIKKLAGHFHDTRGQALTNIKTAYDLGIRTFDASLGGLGGCPYAPGASGNVATEDVVYMFNGMGVDTGLDLAKLIEINRMFTPIIGHELPSKVSKAALAK